MRTLLLFIDRCVRVEPGARTGDLLAEAAGRFLVVSAGAAERYARTARDLATISRLVP